MIMYVALAILYLLILKYAEAPFLRRMSEATSNLKHYNSLRHKLSLTRWGSFIAFYGLMSAYMVWITLIIPREMAIPNLFFIILFPYIVHYYSERNILEKQTVIQKGKGIPHKNDNSVLLLRSFDKDDYTPGQTANKTNKFSEKGLLMWLKPYMKPYAVGNPREANIPSGAERIYVEDDYWRDDVELLMEQCEVLIMLLNNSESCLWELEKAHKFKEKLIVIVDDLEIYESSRTRLKEKVELPKLKEGASFPMLLCHDGVQYNFLRFSYTKPSYRLFADAVLEALSGIRKKRTYTLLHHRHLAPLQISAVCLLGISWATWSEANMILVYTSLIYFIIFSTLSLLSFAVTSTRKKRFKKEVHEAQERGTYISIHTALKHCCFPAQPKKVSAGATVRCKLGFMWSICWRIFAIILFPAMTSIQIIQLVDFFRVVKQATDWDVVSATVHVKTIGGPFDYNTLIHNTYNYKDEKISITGTYNDTSFIEFHQLRDKTLPATVDVKCYVNPNNPQECMLASDFVWPMYEKVSFFLTTLSTLTIVPWCIITLRRPRKHFM